MTETARSAALSRLKELVPEIENPSSMAGIDQLICGPVIAGLRACRAEVDAHVRDVDPGRSEMRESIMAASEMIRSAIWLLSGHTVELERMWDATQPKCATCRSAIKNKAGIFCRAHRQKVAPGDLCDDRYAPISNDR